ncbi:reverse transcriptase domain-containing protein [Tanacetum coccineum]|uniref:Reverse transcriptase domain-containing protein n=1 Tax=Tanacetum coccineum TaxID=301880 RepID=A0ABQ5EEL2_9ASTR
MFNSTLTGSARVWFDDLPPESVDSYDDLKEAFLANFRQQKKCIKDPVEIHHIRQREGESTKDFVRRFKVEIKDVKGAPEIMRISGFMHGITNPELIKPLHDKISKLVDEMMRITTSFLRGEVGAGNQERKKSLLPWKHSKIIPIECAAVSGPEGQPPTAHQAIEERIKEGCPLVRQNKRSKAADRNQAIQEEVEKLIDAGIMKEVHYHNWLSNPVMVKKHDDSWRMCVDFKDLNKACLKKGYPLPEID